MARRSGRAYIFVRWSGSAALPMRLGEIGWAFEFNDRLGRFNSFCCGAVESASRTDGSISRNPWQEKCSTLPQLVKAMSHQGPERPGFDEVKVFDVEECDPENALHVATQRASGTDDLLPARDSLNETREVLSRYGVRGLGDGKAFSAPFLWYNMLPGRSVPLRKLPVHLFQLRASLTDRAETLSNSDVEDAVRRIAEGVAEVQDLGECFVTRVGTGFLVALTVNLEGNLPVHQAHAITDRIEDAVRNGNSHIRHLFIHIEPQE